MITTCMLKFVHQFVLFVTQLSFALCNLQCLCICLCFLYLQLILLCCIVKQVKMFSSLCCVFVYLHGFFFLLQCIKQSNKSGLHKLWKQVKKLCRESPASTFTHCSQPQLTVFSLFATNGHTVLFMFTVVFTMKSFGFVD